MIELIRDHEGKVAMHVNGAPALGAQVTGVNNINGELVAVVLVPLKHTRMGEQSNVVPIRR